MAMPRPSISVRNTSTTKLQAFDSIAEKSHGGQVFTEPFCLQRRIVSILLVLFAIILVVLPVLHRVSTTSNGLSSADENRHYLWTYGPTAVFLILDTCWYQVDYAARRAMPWLALRREVTAEDSLLVDYVSKGSIVSLYTSLKKKHALVAMTTTIALTLKLLSILSTGLLVLQHNTQLHRKVSVHLSDHFDSDAYRMAEHYYTTDTGPTFNRTPVISYYGAQSMKMLYPPYTLPQFAVQRFHPTEQQASNSTITANAEVFYADLGDCHIANVTSIPFQSSTQENTITDGHHINVTSSTCQGVVALNSTFQEIGNSASSYRGILTSFVCLHDQTKLHRLLVSFANVRITDHRETAQVTYLKGASFLCDPWYSVNRVPVTVVGDYDTRRTGLNVDWQPSRNDGYLLEGIDYVNMSQSVLATLDNSASTGLEDLQTFPQDPPVKGDEFTYLVLQQAQKVGIDYVDLVDPDRLEPVARSVYSGVAAQLSDIYLRSPFKQDSTGSMVFEADRLVVRPTAFGLMEGFLAAIFLLTLISMFLNREIGIHVPGRIAAIAAICARSPHLMSLFTKTGTWSLSTVEQDLQGYHFVSQKTDCNQACSIAAISDSEPTGQERPDASVSTASQIRWWRPYSAHPALAALVLLLPTVLIVVLGVLYHQSDRNQGLGDVDETTFARYAWTLVPALLMVIVTMLFETLDTLAKILEPFWLLRLGHATGHDSVMSDYLRTTAILLVPRALKRRRWTLAFATLAVSLGPILTIAVSGLYTAMSVQYSESIDLIPRDRFNITNLDQLYRDRYESFPGTLSMHMDKAIFAPQLILGRNASYPQWTYKDLVFPTMSVQGTPNQKFLQDATILQAKVHALRTSLACQPATMLTARSHEKYVNVSLDINSSCPTYYNNLFSVAADAILDSEIDSQIPADVEGPTTFTVSQNNGPNFKVNQLPFPRSSGDYFGGSAWQLPGLDSSMSSQLDTSCPWVIFALGQIAKNNKTIAQSNFLKCNIPIVEDVLVHTTFNLPSMALNLTTPPTVDESSAKPVSNMTLALVEPIVLAQASRVEASFDEFMAFAVTLAGSEPARLLDSNVFASTMQDTFLTYYTQWLNYVQRVNPSTVSSKLIMGPNPEKLTGTFSNPFRTRLVQSEISTGVLLAVLGILLLCGVIFYATAKLDDVVPMNPCTPTGIMALLSGSRLVEDGYLLSRSRSSSEESLAEAELLGKHGFGLGWWDSKSFLGRDKDPKTEEGSIRFGIDVHVG